MVTMTTPPDGGSRSVLSDTTARPEQRRRSVAFALVRVREIVRTRLVYPMAALSARLIGGCEMARDKGTALARRSRSAPRVVAPRNKVNLALPFSKITADDPMKMKIGDWLILAELAISIIGFSIAIRQLVRIANALEEAQTDDSRNTEAAQTDDSGVRDEAGAQGVRT